MANDVPSSANELTERSRLRRMEKGVRLWFGNPWDEEKFAAETPESRASRTIAASALVEFIHAHNDEITFPIDISYAIIDGKLDWRGVTFHSTVSFYQCEFNADVDISYAEFHLNCSFERNIFRGCVTAAGAHFGANLSIYRSCVASIANFTMAAVEGETQLTGAHFHGNAYFDRFRCEGGLNCLCVADQKSAALRPTRFHGDVSFMDASIRSFANFAGAQFSGIALFERMLVSGSLFFRSYMNNGIAQRTCFYARADFTSMHVEQDLFFQGALMIGPAVFNRMHVDGMSLFNCDVAGNRTWFGDFTNFRHVHLGAEVNFNSASFQRFANFYDSHIVGPLTFRPQPKDEANLKQTGPRVEFLGGARFQDVHVDGNINFSSSLFVNLADFVRIKVDGRTSFGPEGGLPGAVFEQRQPVNLPEGANALVAFQGAHLQSGAVFRGCTFGLPANFDSVQAPDSISFAAATFTCKATFRGAKVGTAYFRVPDGDPLPVNFAADLNIRGLAYDSIYLPVDHFLDKLQDEPERQPFLKLESTLRNMGQEQEADRVFLQHRKYQRARHWRNREIMSWSGSFLYQLIANSGVKPLRLLLVPLLFLAIGSWAFHQPGALNPKEAGQTAPKPAKADPKSPESVSWARAFGISLSEFLPVDIPAGDRLVPSERYMIGWMTYDAYATIHKLAGWLLVPLGVASLAGLLNRSGKAPPAGE